MLVQAHERMQIQSLCKALNTVIFEVKNECNFNHFFIVAKF